MSKVKGEIQNVCIANALYALLQYLLLVDEDVAKNHTFYVFSESINKDIRDKFPHDFFYSPKGNIVTEIKKRMKKMDILLLKNIRYPFLKKAHIYAQDHTSTSLFIGRRDYDLLSDGPNCLTLLMNEESKKFQLQQQMRDTFKGKLMRWFYGDVSILSFGNNTQCKRMYMTEPNRSPVLNGKQVFVKSLNDMWQEATSKKQKWVLEALNITPDMMTLPAERDTMFLSQPFIEDGFLSRDEYIDLLRKLFKGRDLSHIFVKTHPRDHFDYMSVFPELYVYSKQINMQIMAMLGFKVKLAIAIATSAADCLSEEIDLEWYGPECHLAIRNGLGYDIVPTRKYKKVYL